MVNKFDKLVCTMTPQRRGHKGDTGELWMACFLLYFTPRRRFDRKCCRPCLWWLRKVAVCASAYQGESECFSMFQGRNCFFQMIAQLESFSMFQPWIWRPGCIGCLWSHRPCSIWCLPLLQWHWPLAACLGHRCYQVMQCTFVICKQDWCTYTYQSNWRLNRTI